VQHHGLAWLGANFDIYLFLNTKNKNNKNKYE
jgi:hypothetical protein